MRSLKFLLLVSMTISFFGCGHKPSLDGTWIGLYELPYSAFKDNYAHIQYVMEIKGSNLYGKDLYVFAKDTISTYLITYNSKHDQLILNKNGKIDSLRIKIVSSDSIVLSYQKDTIIDRLFKKLKPTETKEQLTLSGKVFRYKNGSNEGIVDFYNDSLSRNFYTSHWNPMSTYWRIRKFHNWQFLILDGGGPPLVLRSIDGGKVVFSRYGKDINDVFFEEIEGKSEMDENLYGKWVRFPYYDEINLPIPEGYEGKIDNFLIIDKDSLDLVRSGIDHKYKWHTNATKEYIDIDIDNNYWSNFWELKGIYKDSLIINKYDNIEKDWKQVKYKRFENQLK